MLATRGYYPECICLYVNYVYCEDAKYLTSIVQNSHINKYYSLYIDFPFLIVREPVAVIETIT